ncbi:MAG: type II toxin-antitoxin system VapB family antitoxin, partial [Mesorhizobium sp.]
MRTNIELDDELIAEAMAASGLKTKKATIEAALRTLVRRHRQDMAIAALAGAGWEGDLDAMR